MDDFYANKTVYRNKAINYNFLTSGKAQSAVFEKCEFKNDILKFSGGLMDNSIFKDCRFSASYHDVKFTNSRFMRCDFSDAFINGANFHKCSLWDCDFTYANFINCDFTGASIHNCRMGAVNLSGSKGLLNPSEWMRDNFLTVDEGFLVLKINGYMFSSPPHWKMEKNAIITEEVNPNRTIDCGCGVNFGTVRFTSARRREVWVCLLHWHDLPSLIVPYNPLQKARCGRLRLLGRTSVRPIDDEAIMDVYNEWKKEN